MSVYVVVHECRHRGVQVEAFRTARRALAHAEDVASGYPGRRPAEALPDAVFAQRLSSEGDYIRVLRRELS